MPKALLARLPILGAFLLGLAGCTVKSTEAPDLIGPSEFGLSFSVTATPDSVPQDGSSTASVVVQAFDSNGAPKANVTFRVEIQVGGVPVDYGMLSNKSIVTRTDGRATTLYTAPPPLPAGANLDYCQPGLFTAILAGGCVEIVATPVGSDFRTGMTQFAQVHLVPQGVILPPAGTPTASFIFSPTTPSANAPVQFDASASSSPNETITSYAWDFGDGTTGSGRTTSHVFGAAQTYSVTLTVTNDRGRSASVTKTVTVAAASTPTAAFVFSPSAPTVKAEVFFDASDSRAGNGHRIVSYQWNWGDGESAPASASPLQQHDYQSAGTFKVVLTVTDESGQIGTTSKDVAVTAGGPTPSFFVVKDASVALKILVDGSASTTTGTATVKTYTWSWGDGTTDTVTTTPQSTHTYAAGGTYNVRLTVTDSLGRSATSAATSVTVP